MSNNVFGIDLGTSNIKIYNRADDTILVEKNMIAIENKSTLFAYGDSAFEMYEKAPGNIHISYPLSNGVIADIKNMELLVKYFINDLTRSNVKPADYYIAVPTDVTEVEKRAFYDLIRDAGVKARRILVVEKAVADGLGLDIDVKNSQGVLIVNVGFDTTEISILSLGGIVLSRLIKVGGQKFDDAIRSAVRKQFSLIIGGKTAEGVKMASAELEREGKGALVYGRDIVTEISVKENIGIDKIKDEIKRLFNIGEISTNDMTYLSNARSIALLKKSLNNINDAINEINNNNPIDIVELSLKESWNNLGEVIGETYTDELLDELFSRFCLGK